jgi:hypothetical protein
MKKLTLFLSLTCLVISGMLFYRASTVRTRPAAPALPAPAPDKKEWKPEEIAKDPQGYLAWSDRQIQSQITEREKRLQQLADRRKQIETRQTQMIVDYKSAQNIHDRMQRALQQAEDEDRWPVRMGGKTFERAKAQQVIDQTDRWLKERQPLFDAYAHAVNAMDDSATGLRNDIANLRELRDKLALDLEKIRLNQGIAELDKLNKSADQLAAMSASLGKMSDEQSPQLPSAGKNDRVDIDSLLR